MNLEEMSQILKSSLGISENIVGVRLFSRGEQIPEGLKEMEKPLHYCSMIQGARKEGRSFLARAEQHACKGGASGLGMLPCPENIASGALYFEKLHKCETPDIGINMATNMPRLLPGSTVATYVAPLDKMVTNPDVVIFVGSPSRPGGLCRLSCSPGAAGPHSTPLEFSPSALTPHHLPISRAR